MKTQLNGILKTELLNNNKNKGCDLVNARFSDYLALHHQGLLTAQNFKIMTVNSKEQIPPNDTNRLLADVVSLEEAKKLSRLGWEKTQTKIGYKKRNNCSVYDKVTSNGRWSLDYDAPNADELKQMCYAVGKVGLSDDLSVSDLVNELIGYCKRQKIKLSDYYIR